MTTIEMCHGGLESKVMTFKELERWGGRIELEDKS